MSEKKLKTAKAKRKSSQNFKKGDWIIAQWKYSQGNEVDIACFLNKYINTNPIELDSEIKRLEFIDSHFFRITKSGVDNLSDCGDDKTCLKSFKYKFDWRKMTQAEKLKYFEIIVKNGR